MAGNIKGITIEIDGNTTKLDKSLKNVEKTSRDVTSSLKSINNSLKFHPGNFDLLVQKQNALKDAVTNTSEKLKQLKEAQKQVKEQFENGEIGRDKFDALNREIIKTEDQLKNFKKELDGINPKFEALGQKFENIGNKMSSVGGAMTKYITAPMVAAGVGVVGLAKKAGETADRLLDLHDITGMSTDKIQEWQHVATEAGVSQESMTAAMEGLIKRIPQLESEGGKATEALNKMGLSYEDLKNKSPDEQVDSLMKALANMQDPLERNAAGSALFGGAWKDLAPMLGMGAKGLDDAKKRAHDLGLVLSNESLQGANKFRQAFDQLKEVINKAAIKIGAEFAPIIAEKLVPLIEKKLVPAISKFINFIKKMIDSFNKLPEPVKKAIEKLVLIAAAMGPILKIGGKLVGGMGGIIRNIPKMISVFKKLTGIIKIVGTAVKALVGGFNPYLLIAAAVIAIGILIYKNWDKISKAAGKLKEAVVGKITAIFNKIKEIFHKIIDVTSQLVQKLKNAFKFKWELPKIKLPHFNISGKFSLNPPSIPKFSIDWHKDGGIFTKPTLLPGMNGGVHGVGEAGSEAILPLNKLKDYIQGGDTFIFNVKFDEVSEIQDFLEMAKNRKRMLRMNGGEVNA